MDYIVEHADMPCPAIVLVKSSKIVVVINNNLTKSRQEILLEGIVRNLKSYKD